MDYIALIHKDRDSDYGVSFPDLPGLITAGNDLDDAKAMAIEALAMHLEGLREDGAEIPPPSSLEEIMANKENRDAVALIVPAAIQSSRAMRVNVTIPEDVLSAIDKRAEAEGFTRSGFLTQAARKALTA